VKFFRRLYILPIRIYQYTISPLLGQNCRHVPTCSQYTIEAITEWGILRGTWMGLKRISKCHPWGTHGYDPVPKRKKHEEKG
jgi:putative membrane protein insertion efficiency factor